jgi:predicted ATPase/DNA-binding SARP family transcriptional activator
MTSSFDWCAPPRKREAHPGGGANDLSTVAGAAQQALNDRSKSHNAVIGGGVVEFRILGPLAVEGAQSLGGPKQRALLAQLVLAAGEPVPADRLVDLVWAERPPNGAMRSLEVYVSRLRQAIAPTGAEIVRRGGGYELVLGDARVDLHEFRSFAAAGRAALGAGDPDGARTSLSQALELWRGPALADLGDAGAQLEEERLAVAEDLADAELQLGRHAELVPELEQRVRDEPLRERTRGQLMLALYRSGRQAEALAAYRDARDALDALGLAPGPELRDLERSILRQEAALTVEPAAIRERRRLPASPTSLVGRRLEIDELTGLLRGSARLVTLTGPGGIGKTRLALQTAHELADAFTDGVWFVGLAPLADPSLVPSAIAAALELRDGSLRDHLAGKELLLLLDNFEHVLDAAPVVSELLAAAPRLKVLATSRTRLDLYGEQDVPVSPLSPEDASTLFVERARAARQGFAPTAAVEALCERFDRLPLALELVAARARELTLPELLESAGLDLAAGGARDLPERQRTLRSAIAWSEDQLEPDERELFAALGVFAGGFERDAVAAVCPGGEHTLPALVDASLVRRDDAGRLRLLAIVREYALARLSESGREQEVRRRHLEHYATIAADLRAKHLGAGEGEAHAVLARERDNLRAALAFAHETGQGEALLGFVRDLSRFWFRAAALAEANEWAEAALAVEDAPPLLRAQALRGAALNDWKRGDLERAEARAGEALSLLGETDEERERLGPLSILGAIAHYRGDLVAAAALYEEGAERARRLGELSFLSIALNNLAGIVFDDPQQRARAGELYAESLAAARELGSQELEAFALSGVGSVESDRGEHELAARGFREAIRIMVELGFNDRVAAISVQLAFSLIAMGDGEGAARLLGAASALRERAGIPPQPQEVEYVEEARDAAEAALGPERFAAAFAAGAADPDGVVARALEG